MDINLNASIGTEANENLSQPAQAEKDDMMELENVPFLDLTDDEKIDIVAARILKRFKPAFEELAK